MSFDLGTLPEKCGPPEQVFRELPTLDFPPIRGRRQGEVCMAIRRLNGCFLLQSKQSYPGSVLRLPSGGIEAGENIEAALLREIWEETNLTVALDAFPAVIHYASGSRRAKFTTHLLVVNEVSGELRSNDPHERISRWGEAGPDELTAYASELERMEDHWNDWGRFRAVALDVLADHCGRSGS